MMTDDEVREMQREISTRQSSEPCPNCETKSFDFWPEPGPARDAPDGWEPSCSRALVFKRCVDCAKKPPVNPWVARIPFDRFKAFVLVPERQEFSWPIDDLKTLLSAERGGVTFL